MPQLRKIAASCQPVPAEDGTQTLNCGGTLTNQTTETVEVVVLGAVPGQQVLDVRGYTLPAGGNVNIPAPPSGGFWVIAARTKRDGEQRYDHGVIAPVRTYEAPIDRRLEEVGFETISTVTLLMKETLVRVAEPALVPAGVR